MYLGPGSERLPNKGEKEFKVRMPNARTINRMTFQDAKVRKPLAAVSGMNDKGNLVLFDKAGSFIIPESCQEVYELRALVKKIQNKIELERRNNVFLMSVMVHKPNAENNQVFSRQGM